MKLCTTLITFLFLLPTGHTQNVGIGTTDPQALLDVAGDARINTMTIGRGSGDLEENMAIGYKALFSNSGGSENTAIGYNSMRLNSIGQYNAATGAYALEKNTTGSFNSGFGAQALNLNTTGHHNTGLGLGALASNNVGNYNTAIGSLAGLLNSSGESNTGIGYSALHSTTTGIDNTALGAFAGTNNQNGLRNTFIGSLSNASVGSLVNATAIGSFAYVAASNSMVLGCINGVNGAIANTNVGIGTTTPAARLDVAADILINGLTAGRGGGSGSENTAFGFVCLQSNSTGHRNNAMGFGSMLANTTGSYNVANGAFTLLHNTSGDYNSAFGDDVMTQNTSGAGNTAIGSQSLYFNTTGNDNTALGVGAGINNSTGSGNTFIGMGSNANDANLANATAIGHRAFVASSNSLVLGSINGVNGATENTNVGIGTTTPSATLDVIGTINATSWKTSSMDVNGYAEMGGVLMQWGIADYTSNTAETITFPMEFNNVFSLTATVDAAYTEGSGVNVPVKVQNISNNTFQIAGMFEFSGDETTKIRWIAVGN